MDRIGFVKIYSNRMLGHAAMSSLTDHDGLRIFNGKLKESLRPPYRSEEIDGDGVDGVSIMIPVDENKDGMDNRGRL